MSNNFKEPLLDLIGTVVKRDDDSPFIRKGQILVKDPSPLKQSVIVISDGFVKSEKLNVVLYLHGHHELPIDQYFKNRKLKEIIDKSKASFVLIAPQLGGTSEFLTSGADAIAYVKRMLEMLAQYGPFTSAPTINNLIMAGHSGGGAPMLDCIGWFKGTFNVKQAWALDCMYVPGKAMPTPAPTDLSEKNIATWRQQIEGTTEHRWYKLAKAGLSVKGSCPLCAA